PTGSGDQWVSQQISMSSAVVVLNKTDKAPPSQIMKQLKSLSQLGAAEYFPVSAATGDGVAELVDYLAGRLPEGDPMYPPEATGETPDQLWVAELVREQLLQLFDDELPYSIATRITEWEWPRIRCEIIVERESQKGMVIGKNGSVLKVVGTNVRKQLPPGVFIELFVVVDKNWQHRPDRVERLGY
ncbi:MAG: KH domain-containing protein, partial [Ilumatobacteraceae bacterium]